MQTETKKAQHTPGPWEAIPAKNEHGEPTISIRGDGQFIATMDTVSVDGGEYSLPPEAAANARLIAAAPDLLAALQRLRDAVQTAHVGSDERCNDCAVCVSLKLADEALSKV